MNFNYPLLVFIELLLGGPFFCSHPVYSFRHQIILSILISVCCIATMQYVQCTSQVRFLQKFLLHVYSTFLANSLLFIALLSCLKDAIIFWPFHTSEWSALSLVVICNSNAKLTTCTRVCNTSMYYLGKLSCLKVLKVWKEGIVLRCQRNAVEFFDSSGLGRILGGEGVGEGREFTFCGF